MNNDKIAVYGGSFNPPTLAHKRIASGILEIENKVDRIILLPSGIRKDKNFGLENEQRLILLEEFYNSLLEDDLPVEIDRYFFDGKNGHNTTTVQEDAYFKETRSIQPEFIYGSDVISNMQNWDGNTKKYIEHTLKKIFIPRSGYDHIKPETYDMKNYRFIEIKDMPEVSSSLAKEYLKTSQSLEGILSPKIAELITKNNLYTQEK